MRGKDMRNRVTMRGFIVRALSFSAVVALTRRAPVIDESLVRPETAGWRAVRGMGTGVLLLRWSTPSVVPGRSYSQTRVKLKPVPASSPTGVLV